MLSHLLDRDSRPSERALIPSTRDRRVTINKHINPSTSTSSKSKHIRISSITVRMDTIRTAWRRECRVRSDKPARTSRWRVRGRT
jgi:hypothetical protein